MFAISVRIIGMELILLPWESQIASWVGSNIYLKNDMLSSAGRIPTAGNDVNKPTLIVHGTLPWAIVNFRWAQSAQSNPRPRGQKSKTAQLGMVGGTCFCLSFSPKNYHWAPTKWPKWNKNWKNGKGILILKMTKLRHFPHHLEILYTNLRASVISYTYFVYNLDAQRSLAKLYFF